MSSEDPFNVEVEKAVRNALYSPKTTHELLQEVVNSKILTNYFKHITNNMIHNKLLFLHRLDLFGLEGVPNFPYLHLSDLSKKEIDGNIKHSKALEHASISRTLEGENFYKEFFDIDEAEWDKFSQDFKDIVFYFGILFARKNPDIIKLINEPEFNYEKMKRMLKDYSILVDFEATREKKDTKQIIEKEEIDPIIISKAEKLGVNVVKSSISNLDNIISQMKNLATSVFLPFHAISKKWLSDLLSLAALSYEEYIEILDDLYTYKLLQTKSMISWCEKCYMESDLMTTHIGNIAPSKLTKEKCLICGKTKSYAAIFSLDETLNNSILSKNGLLAVYFSFLLSTNNIPYETEISSRKYENDFIISESVLVECKMFKANKDLDGIKSEVQNGLAQLQKHAKQLEKEGKPIKKCCFLWNRDIVVDDEFFDKFHSYASFMKKYKFEIIYKSSIESFISKLKK